MIPQGDGFLDLWLPQAIRPTSTCVFAVMTGSERIRLDRGVFSHTKREHIFREVRRATSTRHATYFESLRLFEVQDLYVEVHGLVS